MSEEQVVAISFDAHGRPWSVVAIDDDAMRQSVYDVEYCERDDCLYYHLSASLPVEDRMVWLECGRDVWVHPEFSPRFNPGVGLLRQRDSCPKEYAGHPEEYASHEDTIYCTLCEDHLPADCDVLCDHVAWDEELGWWCGPGHKE